MGYTVCLLRFRVSSKTVDVSGIWRVLECGSARSKVRTYVGVCGSAFVHLGGLESVVTVLEVSNTRGMIAVTG